MIKGKSNRQAVLDLLKDRRPHFSAEFRDVLGLLEYRKRISELRAEGHTIVSFRIVKRPAYQLVLPQKDFFENNL